MKKIYFSITRAGKFSKTFKGYGYITDEDLIAYPDTKYERKYEDCIRYCHPIVGKYNQYSGTYTELKEIEYEAKPNSYDKREIEVTYYIWYKVIN